MKNYSTIEARADALMNLRGIAGHTAAERFVKDFKAYLIYFDATGQGNAEDTLNCLENNENLTDNKIFNKNFRGSLDDLISANLRADAIFPKLFAILLDNNGKGVGQGELVLPLIIAGYKFSNESDGVLDTGARVEVKKNGASLKPVKTGVTEKGLVDKLNKKYWNNTVPGKRRSALFEAHVKSVTDPADYAKYFEELYVGCDVSELASEVAQVYKDSEKFNTALGKFALKQYQKVDGWQNIIYIDAETQQVVNIADPNNIQGLNLKFSPVMQRANDTQAIADGYVNVKI